MTYQHRGANGAATLRADSERHGLISLRVDPPGIDLVREPYFLLNIYRFMCAGRLLTIARDEPFDVERVSSGLAVRWRPTEAHPGRVEAVYALREDTVDLILTAEVDQPVAGYEVYISSYFDFSLAPYAVVSIWPGKTDRSDMRLLKLDDNPFLHGHYIVLPRDAGAAAMRFDGRWINARTGRPIAYWASGPFYGRPVAIMARTDLFVVQMADPGACIGIGASYASPDPADDIAHHNATYFSFFGEDLRPGERRTARIRQVVCRGSLSLEKVLDLYDAFQHEEG